MYAAASQGTHNATKSVCAAASQGTQEVTKSVHAEIISDYDIRHLEISCDTRAALERWDNEWTMASLLDFEDNLFNQRPQHIAGMTDGKVAKKNDNDHQPSSRYCPNIQRYGSCGKAYCMTIHDFDPNCNVNNSNLKNCNQQNSRENKIRDGNKYNSQDNRGQQPPSGKGIMKANVPVDDTHLLQLAINKTAMIEIVGPPRGITSDTNVDGWSRSQMSKLRLYNNYVNSKGEGHQQNSFKIVNNPYQTRRDPEYDHCMQATYEEHQEINRYHDYSSNRLRAISTYQNLDQNKTHNNDDNHSNSSNRNDNNHSNSNNRNDNNHSDSSNRNDNSRSDSNNRNDNNHSNRNGNNYNNRNDNNHSDSNNRNGNNHSDISYRNDKNHSDSSYRNDKNHSNSSNRNDDNHSNRNDNNHNNRNDKNHSNSSNRNDNNHSNSNNRDSSHRNDNNHSGSSNCNDNNHSNGNNRNDNNHSDSSNRNENNHSKSSNRKDNNYDDNNGRNDCNNSKHQSNRKFNDFYDEIMNRNNDYDYECQGNNEMITKKSKIMSYTA